MSTAHTHKRFWLGFDRHTPEHDPLVDMIVADFLADFKPHIRVAGGDWQTVDQVSHFNNESETDLADEFDMNRDAIERFGITHYLMGNHEERLERIGMLDKRLRKVAGLQRNLQLSKLGIKLLPYHPRRGILKIGELKVLHGFFTNEYMAKKTASIYGTCVFGHAHRFQTFQSKQAFYDRVGFSIGMLGKTTPSWIEHRAPMGWAQGFAFGYLHRGGLFDLYPVRIIDGRVTINGRIYGNYGRK